jgi:CheY-like chemotaxis protein
LHDRSNTQCARPEQEHPCKTGPKTLAGRHILLVEDDYFIAGDFAAAFEAAGATVNGLAATLVAASELAMRSERLDGAVLDINLQGRTVYPLVDKLQGRGVPVVFASGYDRSTIPERYAGVPLCDKPVDPTRCARALFG